MPEKMPGSRNSSFPSKIAPSIELSFLKRLEKPVIEAFSKLQPDIESGAFGSIIGIDASGRIPAMLAFEVIRLVYEQNGYPAPQTRFFAGRANWKEVRDHLEKYPLDKTKKVLVTEDSYITGDACAPIIQALDSLGYEAEVLTLYAPRNSGVTYLTRPEPDQEQIQSLKNAYKDSIKDLQIDNRDDLRKRLQKMTEFESEKEKLQQIKIPVHIGEKSDIVQRLSEISGVRKENGNLHATPVDIAPKIKIGVENDVKLLSKKIVDSWSS